MKNRVYHEKQGLSWKTGFIMENRVYLRKKQGLSEKKQHLYCRKTGFILQKTKNIF